MKYNTNTRFSQNPASLDITRSVFDRVNNHKTTFNAGKLIPVYCEEVLPGDTVTMDTSFLVRMTTPIFPVMDNAFIDLFWFFVPNRLVWDKWKEFNGENDVNAWVNTENYIVPAITSDPSDNDTIKRGSLADYFGLPTNVPIRDDIRINALPFRGYQLTWNEYFRDQNLQNPLLIDTSSSDFMWYEIENGLNKVLPVNKIHDYFTSCLPSPQKGNPVLLGFESDVAVFTGYLHNYMMNGAVDYPLKMVKVNSDGDGSFDISQFGPIAIRSGSGTVRVNSDGRDIGGDASVAPGNLYANTTALTISVNQLRQAFQVQKLLERDARGGTRYWELIKSHFGVTAPDASLQRPEFLGSSRTYINMTQVVQNSSSDTTSPQGNTAAFSKTVNSENSFTKSFTEHGFLFGLCCVRTDHTYQQGINKKWLRQSRFDYYWPALANIGEQPVMLHELYYDGESDADQIFGYQEAWASYRYSPSYVTGAFRSNVSGSLDSWHYADFYDSRPYLSDAWVQETSANIDRTLAVQSSLEDQFLGDFYFKSKWTRPMPVYSVPGLVDHH